MTTKFLLHCKQNHVNLNLTKFQSKIWLASIPETMLKTNQSINQLVQCWAHSVKAMYIQIMKSVFVAYFYIIDDDNLREN